MVVYIIDTYNRYNSFDRENSKHTFQINNMWYAIKEVQLVDGKPALPIQIESNND